METIETTDAATPLALEAFSDDRPWAITPGFMRGLIRTTHHPDFDALAARAGAPLANDTTGDVENHNGTAVVNIRGPLFRYRSIWTWLLGGTAVEDASLGLNAALDNPAVNAIVLAINSPGGQIDGINEFANMIRAASARKPVTAYVEGMGASGAYWLASAAGKIVADETAQLGSIGVLATVVDDRAAEERRGVKRYDVISTQSPLKRTDAGSDEGRALLQSMVDGLAQVFIEKVAAFRGVSAEKVMADFGHGAMLGARAAVAAGMADGLGSLQALLGGDTPIVRAVRDKPALRVEVPALALNAGGPDDEEEEDEDDDDKNGTDTKGEGHLTKPTEEQQRIAAILTCEEARGREELARTLALETDLTAEAAQKLLTAAPVAPKPNALDNRMGEIPNPKVGAGAEKAEDTPAAEVQRILAFVPKTRRHAVQ